jgi:hypothetical protein
MMNLTWTDIAIIFAIVVIVGAFFYLLQQHSNSSVIIRREGLKNVGSNNSNMSFNSLVNQQSVHTAMANASLTSDQRAMIGSQCANAADYASCANNLALGYQD